MTEQGSLTVDVQEKIARISFAHPKANCLSGSMLHQLTEAITTAATDSRVRVMQLRSDGGTFCAGASFSEFEQLSSVDQAEEFFSKFAALFLAMRSAPKWIVARVQGKAVGGGVGLIAGADYAVAAPELAIRLSEFSLDFGPYVIGPVVERRIGTAHFAALALDGKWRDSAWCYARGLIDERADSLEALDTEQEKLLGALTSRSERATSMLKTTIWQQTERWETLLYQRARMSAELLIAKRETETVA